MHIYDIVEKNSHWIEIDRQLFAMISQENSSVYHWPAKMGIFYPVRLTTTLFMAAEYIFTELRNIFYLDTYCGLSLLVPLGFFLELLRFLRFVPVQ